MLKGKRGIILGAINHRSVAFSVANKCINENADVILTCANSNIAKKLETKAEVLTCDLSDQGQIDTLCNEVVEKFGKLDFIVHSVAYANMNHARLLDASVADFMQAIDISCYSFTSLIKTFMGYLNPGASCIAMSYIGSQKSVFNYNLMSVAKAALESSLMYLAMDCGSRGIRVNAISSGPLRTISGAAISQAREIYNYSYKKACINEATNQGEIADIAAFLISDMAKSITAEIINVDSGFSSVAISDFDLEKV